MGHGGISCTRQVGYDGDTAAGLAFQQRDRKTLVLRRHEQYVRLQQQIVNSLRGDPSEIPGVIEEMKCCQSLLKRLAVGSVSHNAQPGIDTLVLASFQNVRKPHHTLLTMVQTPH